MVTIFIPDFHQKELCVSRSLTFCLEDEAEEFLEPSRASMMGLSIDDFGQGSKYSSIIGRNLLPH